MDPRFSTNFLFPSLVLYKYTPIIITITFLKVDINTLITDTNTGINDLLERLTVSTTEAVAGSLLLPNPFKP